MINKLTEILELYNDNNKLQNLINVYKDNIQKNNDKISAFFKDDKLKLFINQKLQESIDKFDLNANKDANEVNEVTSYSSNSNIDTETQVNTYQVKNPNSIFNPFKDEWILTNIEEQNGAYKITVENVKGRKYIGAFNWIVDNYYTDWFTFNDMNNG